MGSLAIQDATEVSPFGNILINTLVRTHGLMYIPIRDNNYSVCHVYYYKYYKIDVLIINKFHSVVVILKKIRIYQCMTLSASHCLQKQLV